MNKKYVVRLTDEERKMLTDLVGKGTTQAYRIRHATILLKVDAGGPNWSDQQTAEAVGCHDNTVRHVRERFVLLGFEAAIERKKQETPPRKRVLDGAGEARLIAEGCSQAPAGRARWTLHLLADRMVELNVVDSISHETVRQTLKKTS
jgi:hypothetical protein